MSDWLSWTLWRAVPVGVSLFILGRKPAGHADAPKWRPSKGPADAEAALERWAAALKAQGASGDQYLIIGAGSLGCRIARALLLRGERRIRFLDARETPALQELLAENEAGRVPGCGGAKASLEYVRGDVTKLSQIEPACEGVDTVYCNFAIIRFFERLSKHKGLSHRVNVEGTQNVLRACQAAGVKRFVQTSTSNVALPKSCAERGPSQAPLVLDESSPYVTEQTKINHYGTSKALAEQAVLAANGSNGGTFLTGSVRPCSGIFSDNDGIILQPFLQDNEINACSARAVSDWVYVENVVWGHLLLEKELRAENAEAVGKVFAVTNGQPLSTRDFHQSLMHYQPSIKLRYLPVLIMKLVAQFVEVLSLAIDTRCLGKLQFLTPCMFLVLESSYVYDDRLAREVLKYAPMFTVDEGLQLSVSKFQMRQAAR